MNQAEPNWQPVPPRSCVKPTQEAADAFWKYWTTNGDTHKHGYYEATWGAINAALAFGYFPPADDEAVRLLREARELIVERGESLEVPLQFRQHGWLRQIDAYLARVEK